MDGAAKLSRFRAAVFFRSIRKSSAAQGFHGLNREIPVGSTFTILAAGLLVAQSAASGPAPIPTNAPTNDPSKPCNCQKNATQGYVQPVAVAPSAGSGSPGLFRGLFKGDESVVTEERPTIFSRIGGIFKKNDAAQPAPIYSNEPPVEAPRPGPFRMMQRLPAGQPTNEPGALSIPANAPPATTQIPPAPVKYTAVPPGQPAPAPVVVPQSAPTTTPAIKPVSATGTTVSGTNVIKTTDLPPSRPNRISPDLVNKVGHETDYSWITGQLHIEGGFYVIHYATPEVIDQYNGSLVLTADRDLRGFQDGDFVSVRGQVAGGVNGRVMYRVQSIDRLQR